MRRPSVILIIILSLFFSSAYAQKDFSEYFEEAYRLNPSIPLGLLESVAYTNTRMNHLVPDPNVSTCSGMPPFYGVMGLVDNGKGYFKENLKSVSKLSGYSVEEIKKSPRINILAYAKAYAAMQQQQNMVTRGVEEQQDVLLSLSEIPDDGSVVAEYAKDQQFYAVLKQVEKSGRSLGGFDYEEIFGKNKASVLSARSVSVNKNEVRSVDGSLYLEERSADGCSGSKSQTDFEGAIWNPANRNNYGSRGSSKIEYVTIHTIQGSYASCISWFKNPAARVSAHYAIRAFDGQITQMVCEEEKAFHVRADNDKAIGIEHEGFVEDGGTWYTTAMYESSAALVKDICARRGINPLQMYSGKGTSGKLTLGNACRKIKGHQHFPENDHVDPGKDWDWDRFYRLVNGFLPENRIMLNTPIGEVVDDGGKNGNYGGQQRIGYFIQPPGATSITLTFVEMDLEAEPGKPYDYIDIYQGKTPDGEPIGRYSGKTLPSKINIKGGNVYIEFVSDCQVNQGGFVISYAANNANVAALPVEDIDAKNIYPMGAAITWKHSGADKYFVFIKNTLEEKWVLYETQEKGIEIAGLTSGRKYQYRVKALVGKDTSAAESGNFTTPAVSRSGASAIYTTTLNNGKFYDSGGSTNGYAAKEDYVYRIIPDNGGKVKIKFTSFDTEATDVITLYDGDGRNAKKLGEISGSSPDKKEFISSGNALTLHFTSDSKIQGKGWMAGWETIGGNGTGNGGIIVSNNNTTTGGNTGGGNAGGGNTGGGNTPVVGPFEVKITYPELSPLTKPGLKPSYSTDGTVTFEDTDKSGKGIAHQFYLIAENRGKDNWKGNTGRGFYYDDFDKGLSSEWKSVKGKWDEKKGLLTQSDAGADNANIASYVLQNENSTYLYEWNARTVGSSANKRCGFHFFSDDPEKENRGNSYFIWARDTDKEDKIEIYKTNGGTGKFEMKNSNIVKFENNKAYNIKVVYSPSTGKITVFLNNRFVVTWTDPEPLKSGKGISFRTGGSVAEFDNLKIYKSRTSTVEVKVGKEADKDFRVASLSNKAPSARVHSVILDKENRWSKEAVVATVVAFGSGNASGGNTGGGSSGGGNAGGGNTGGGNTGGNNTGGGNTTFITQDFTQKAPSGSNILQTFYLVGDYNGKGRYANESAGFAMDEFDSQTLYEKWIRKNGTWIIDKGSLSQADENAINGNLALPVSQKKGGTYLYHFRTKLVSKGDNRRFGLHIYSSDGTLPNRGESYLVWMRQYEDPKMADKLEVYRSTGTELKAGSSATFSMENGKWYDMKIVLESATGTVTVWINNQKVLSWKDTNPLSTGGGNFISFRTGNAKADFDNLKVYQLMPASATITLGNKPDKFIRFENSGNIPAGKIYSISRDKTDKWIKDDEQEVNVKFK